MAQANEQVTGLTKADLQEMMLAVIKAAKEPTDAEKAKAEKEQQTFLSKAKEMADLAKTQEQTKKNRWLGCPHYDTYNGRRFNKWVGQVNSNGMVAPICNICHVEAPPFSATLLPDGGKQGVNFEAWNDASRETLEKLHRASFSGDCKKSGCLVCDQKKA
jgi:hypothetical protein